MLSEPSSTDTAGASEPDEGPVIPRRRVKDSGDMDITPMIDITFLLLIFFIVSSTMSKSSDVELAKARHGRGVEASSCVEITIERDGRSGAQIYLAGQTDALAGNEEQQAAEIRAAVIADLNDPKKDKTEVLIKADKGVHYRHVDRVKQALADIEGLEFVHFAVEEVR